MDVPSQRLTKAKIKVDKQAIAQERKKRGRFVLSTNDLDLTVDEILSHPRAKSNCTSLAINVVIEKC